MEDLNWIKSKEFNYKDVMNTLHIDDYAELHTLIDQWIADNKISPIKKKGKTSFFPSIYVEYRKLDQKADYSEYEKEIRTLNPKLDISRYLKNQKAFVDKQKEILELSEYLWNKSERLEKKMSVKERSYDIWKDEKFLESGNGKQICAWNQLDKTYLNFFYAPESFFFFDFDQDCECVTALIIENKDTWYTLGKALKQSEHKFILNQKIDMLIYGEGNKATRTNGITEFIEDRIRKPYKVFYAGDLDIAGLDMMYRCMASNNEGYIQPFVELYQRMLVDVEINLLKLTDDHRGFIYEKAFLEYFNDKEQLLIRQVLEENKRIPQEVLNYSDYLELVN